MPKEIDYEEIIKNKWIVEFNRKPFDKNKRLGFLLDFNDEFTFIQDLDTDWYQTDGYSIFQNKTVKKFRVFDQEDYFLNEVVRIKKLQPKIIPQIPLDNWALILQRVNDDFNLVGIESELIYKNQRNIGRLEKIDKKKFSLIEIDAVAGWHETPVEYKFKDLTIVSFGNSYNETLWKVSENRKKIELNIHNEQSRTE